MFGQIVAFLAVVASVAFANPCGPCCSGFGSYVNSPVISVLPSGGFRRVLNAGCDAELIASGVSALPVVSSRMYSAPFFRETVGRPEIYSTCENAIRSPVVVAPVVSSGICGSGCGSRVIASVY